MFYRESTHWSTWYEKSFFHLCILWILLHPHFLLHQLPRHLCMHGSSFLFDSWTGRTQWSEIWAPDQIVRTFPWSLGCLFEWLGFRFVLMLPSSALRSYFPLMSRAKSGEVAYYVKHFSIFLRNILAFILWRSENKFGRFCWIKGISIKLNIM